MRVLSFWHRCLHSTQRFIVCRAYRIYGECKTRRKVFIKVKKFCVSQHFQKSKSYNSWYFLNRKRHWKTFCNLVTSIMKKVSIHTEINTDLGNFNITYSEMYFKEKKKGVLFSPLKREYLCGALLKFFRVEFISSIFCVVKDVGNWTSLLNSALCKGLKARI